MQWHKKLNEKEMPTKSKKRQQFCKRRFSFLQRHSNNLKNLKHELHGFDLVSVAHPCIMPY